MPGWTALKDRLARDAPMRRYDRVAEALVTAYRTGEDGAMRIVWDYFGHMRAWDGDAPVRAPGSRQDRTAAEPAKTTPSRSRRRAAWWLARRGSRAGRRSRPSRHPSRQERRPSPRSRWPRTPPAIRHRAQVAARSRDWDEVFAADARAAAAGPARERTDDRRAARARLAPRSHHRARSGRLEGPHRRRRAPSRAAAAAAAPEPDGLRHHRSRPRGAAAAAGARDDRAGVDADHRRRRGAISRRASVSGSVDLSGTPTGDGAIRALAGKRELRELPIGQRRHRRRPGAAARAAGVQDLAGRRSRSMALAESRRRGPTS